MHVDAATRAWALDGWCAYQTRAGGTLGVAGQDGVINENGRPGTNLTVYYNVGCYLTEAPRGANDTATGFAFWRVTDPGQGIGFECVLMVQD